MSALFAALGGPCALSNNGDPTVNYDALADRWVLTQFALTFNPLGPFYQCVAVSQTPDPTGAYYTYAFVASQVNLNDYPKFGVWPDAYYMSVNEFEASSGFFSDAGVFAFDREKMLVGDPTASFIYFNLEALFPGQGIGGILPSTLDNSLSPPPPGRPNTFLYFTANEFGDPQGDALRLFDFHVDFANPTMSSFVERPDSPIPVAAFNPLTPPGRNDVEQPFPATTNRYLDTIGDRVMHRLQYRNFGPSEGLVVNHTVNVGTGNTIPTHQAAPRYYQLRNTGSGFFILNQGTFAPEGVDPDGDGAENRWMGSIASDNDGNLALGYSVSSLRTYPSIRVTGRLATDPPNTLQPEVSLKEGAGVQMSTSGRWGDYSSMNVDPVDDCTFWYTQEYYRYTDRTPNTPPNGINWQTRVGSFRFAQCTPPPKGTLQVTVTDCATGQPIPGAAVAIDGNLYGATNASGSFPTQLSPGTYTITVSAPNGFSATTQTVTITDGGTTTADVCLTPGSSIVSAGATLVAESCSPPNGAVDPGETVSVDLKVTNAGFASTTNLIGTLLPSANVTNPSGPQEYGAIPPGGMASRTFSFTAGGNCGDTITLMLQLQDGEVNLGVVTYTLTLGATSPTSFANSSPITIPASGPASPYPSSIAVSGLTGTVSKVTVTLNNMSHTFPDDIDILLVGPAGQKVVIMSDAGGGFDINNVTLTFDDAAATPLPNNLQIMSGTFRPSSYPPAEIFPAPAPPPPYAAALSAFNGTNPNGTWSLYVLDQFSPDAGAIAGGWSLSITTQPVCATDCGGTARLQRSSPLSRDALAMWWRRPLWLAMARSRVIKSS